MIALMSAHRAGCAEALDPADGACGNWWGTNADRLTGWAVRTSIWEKTWSAVGARRSVSRVIPQYVLSDVDHIVGRKMLNG